ncbi:MAG: cytochrome c maturation protein CcmE [Hyphomonadaceae bacterium]|nr:cytochrome c maturation protein CcmE [Hyphomonadaceae bacterium]
MRRRDQRLIVVGVAGVLLALAAWLTVAGLSSSVVYFYAPSELAERAEVGRTVRLGGLVLEGSVQNDADGAVRFTVTDGQGQIEVRYAGVLPDLFREGQGVVTEGVYQPGQLFQATQVLAKHDETYMPREVAEALKQRGEWKGGE